MADGKVYKYQVLEIKLDTTVDLTDAVDPQIKAFPPSGPPRYWDATVTETTKLTYTTVEDTDLDQAGEWRFQALPHLSGAEAPGETVDLIVYNAGY